MYFFKAKGRQVLDLRGNLILTFNPDLVRARVSSAAPRAVRNATYVALGARPGFRARWRATAEALRFIWGAPQPLTAQTIELEEGARK